MHPSASLQRRDILRNTLYEQNTQFERLVSGQESESGEAPPSYESVATSQPRVVTV